MCRSKAIRHVEDGPLCVLSCLSCIIYKNVKRAVVMLFPFCLNILPLFFEVVFHVWRRLEVNTKFWYGVMNLGQMTILEAICNFTIFNDHCRG